MKCIICGKEMKNTVGGNYICECGFLINDLVYRGGNFNLHPPILQQGWECPKCGAVMSPHTSVCVNCNGQQQVSINGCGNKIVFDEMNEVE